MRSVPPESPPAFKSHFGQFGTSLKGPSLPANESNVRQVYHLHEPGHSQYFRWTLQVEIQCAGYAYIITCFDARNHHCSTESKQKEEPSENAPHMSTINAARAPRHSIHPLNCFPSQKTISHLLLGHWFSTAVWRWCIHTTSYSQQSFGTMDGGRW